MIKLPGTEKKDDSKEKPEEKNVTKLEEQLSSLVAQVDELSNMKKVDEENKKKIDEDSKAEQLAAEADLRTLLSANDNINEEAEPSGVDDMSHANLLDAVATSVDKAIGARLEQLSQGIDDKIKKTNESVDSICTLLGQMHANSGLQDVRSKYEDFDQFKADTLAVLKKYPNMEVEDAYLLAKQVRAGDTPNRNETDLERPNINPYGNFSNRREEVKPERKENRRPAGPDPTHGVVQIRDLLRAATEKVIGGRINPGR